MHARTNARIGRVDRNCTKSGARMGRVDLNGTSPAEGCFPMAVGVVGG